MISITLLKPTWDKARTAKTFQLQDGKPQLKEAYELGKFFRHKEVTVDGIKGFYSLLEKCADAPLIRISGKPIDGLTGQVQRLKENFVDAGTKLLLIDCDDWLVPDDCTFRTPEGIYKTVKELICNKIGLKMLANVACCVLLSSSFWNYKRIRAHVYFALSSAVNLSTLHDWATAYNATSPEYKLDPSLFRQVQPDFISRRKCEGFIDPLPDSLRLTLHCDNLQPTADAAALVGHFNTVVNMSSAFNYSVVKSLPGESKDKIAETWEETLKQCGTAQHGINEPAYRACAQLVQAIGNSVVEKNLQYYTDKIFNLVWQSINTHGVRGDKKDREYYDKPRFRNYLQTALAKQFGESTDQRVSEVVATLKSVIAGADPSILFDRDMIETYRTIRAKDPGKWASIRSVIKGKLKGTVAISDIDKSLASFNKEDISTMMDKIFSSFVWIEGTIDQGLYCRRDNGKSYSIVGIDGGVESDLYAKALELYADAVPPQFERNLMKVLVSRSRDAATTPFNKAVVENRYYTEIQNGKNVTYVNLGTIDKEMQTCVIDENGLNITPSLQSPVIWSTDRQLQSMEIEYKKGQESELMGFYIKKMRQFVTVEDAESLVDVMAWQIASVINEGTAHLLEFTGASGDGKTVSALLTKELIDPTSSDIRRGQDLHHGFYKKEDLAKTLRSRHVTIFDNLGNLTPTMQDLLCSIATGWKYDLRVMYTQEYIRLIIKKPIIITALGGIITNQDLRSRSFSVSVSRRKKMASGDIYADWERNSAKMRAGMFLFVAKTLKLVNAKRFNCEDLNERDLWGEAARFVILSHLNYKNGDAAAIRKAIFERKRYRDINEALMSSRTSVVIAWIMNDSKSFDSDEASFTPTEMFTKFKNFVNDNAGNELRVGKMMVEISPRKIPATARAFGILVSQTRNDIQAVTGYTVETGRRGGGVRCWNFTKEEK